MAAKNQPNADTGAESFTKEERAALKERARELKVKQTQEEAEQDVLNKIAEMPASEGKIALGLHELVTEHAPQLLPKTWYGMPGWALDGKIVIFFQSADKFKARYSTLGFNDTAQLDDGSMWPTAFAISDLEANRDRVVELIKRAAVAGNG